MAKEAVLVVVPALDSSGHQNQMGFWGARSFSKVAESVSGRLSLIRIFHKLLPGLGIGRRFPRRSYNADSKVDERHGEHHLGQTSALPEFLPGPGQVVSQFLLEFKISSRQSSSGAT